MDIFKELKKKLKKEEKWLIKEDILLSKLKKHIEKKDIKKTSKYIKKAARTVSRVYPLMDKTSTMLDEARFFLPDRLHGKIKDIESKIGYYSNDLLKILSRELKEKLFEDDIDWETISDLSERAFSDLRQLLVVLDWIKHLHENIPVERCIIHGVNFSAHALERMRGLGRSGELWETEGRKCNKNIDGKKFIRGRGIPPIVVRSVLESPDFVARSYDDKGGKLSIFLKKDIIKDSRTPDVAVVVSEQGLVITVERLRRNRSDALMGNRINTIYEFRKSA